MAVRIGELLLKEKRITPEQLQEALSYQRQNGGKLGANLVKLGFVKDEEITSLLSKQYGVPSISLNQFEIDPAVIKLVPGRDRPQVPDHPAQPGRRDAHHRDDRPDQRLRPRRPEVHDRLQRRAGGGLGDGGPRRHPEVLRRAGGRRQAVGQPEDHRNGAGESALEIATRAMSEMPLHRRRRRRGARGAGGDQRRGADPAGRGSAGHQAGQRDPDVGHLQGRQRHPRRALREGIPGPLPHRRHPLQRDEPAAQDARRHHLAHQDHGQARHRREAPAAGRPHQDPLLGRGRRSATSTSASRACRRSSARRSSCVCSTAPS